MQHDCDIRRAETRDARGADRVSRQSAEAKRNRLGLFAKQRIVRTNVRAADRVQAELPIIRHSARQTEIACGGLRPRAGDRWGQAVLTPIRCAW